MKKNIRKEPLAAFLLGAFMYILVFLPTIISTGGSIVITGDYNMQSIPFAYRIYDALHSAQFNWDWSVGLGSQFLASYSYYNLFSPFTLLYMLFPRSALMVGITIVSAIKYGTGTLLAYLYVRRFVKNGNYAVIAGLVYMFSSFTGYNLIFHFADVFALFPLLLIALEELCVNDRRGVFAATVTLMSLLNYYFFFGQVIFCVIYYFARCTDKKFGWSWKRLLYIAVEAVIGLSVSMVMYVPLIAVLTGSAKATAVMGSGEMLAYNSVYYYLKIIQSAFMIPDPFYFVSLFPAVEDIYPYGAAGASVAAYIPLFSMAGVISYIFAKKHRAWENILLAVCAIMAFVPALNQLFSALNTGFYTRWYYMPMLIAAMISVKTLEEKISFKPGIIVCGGIVIMLLIYNFFLRSERAIAFASGRLKFSMPENLLHFGITIVSLVLLIIVLRQKRDKEFFPKLYIMTAISVYMTFGVMCYYLTSLQDAGGVMELYSFGSELPEEADATLRTTSSVSDAENFNQIWGIENTRYFNSILPEGFEEFLGKSGMKYAAGVYRDIDVANRAVTDLCSVKSLFTAADKTPDRSHQIGSFGEWNIYENEDYIPMGFVYDSVISSENFAKAHESSNPETDPNRLYLRALVADDPTQFADILPETTDVSPVSDEEYSRLVEKRREVTCTDLVKTNDGLTASINLESENIVFFSVSYCDGWRAFVDGTETDVLRVNNGLIGIRAPQGSHDLSLVYSVPGLKTGAVISICGIAAFAAYITLVRLSRKRSRE